MDEGSGVGEGHGDGMILGDDLGPRGASQRPVDPPLGADHESKEREEQVEPGAPRTETSTTGDRHGALADTSTSAADIGDVPALAPASDSAEILNFISENFSELFAADTALRVVTGRLARAGDALQDQPTYEPRRQDDVSSGSTASTPEVGTLKNDCDKGHSELVA